MTHFLGLRIDGVEGSNDELDCWLERLRYVVMIVTLIVLAVIFARENR